MNQRTPFRLPFAIAIALTAAPIPIPAQPALSFEVASIKPSDAVKNAGVASGWSFSYTHTGLKTIGSLRSFIKQAYDIEDAQISGGPAWLDRDVFEIDARSATPVSLSDLKKMLQSLLADRFKLAIHTETKQLTAYSLTVAKNGLRLQPSNDGNTGFSTGATSIRGAMDTAELARHLTSTLGRPVIDNTGLKGAWKFALTWAPEDQTTGPSIFTAIQEQLGLKLESTKGPVPVLVVDRAEKPSEN